MARSFDLGAGTVVRSFDWEPGRLEIGTKQDQNLKDEPLVSLFQNFLRFNLEFLDGHGVKGFCRGRRSVVGRRGGDGRRLGGILDRGKIHHDLQVYRQRRGGAHWSGGGGMVLGLAALD